MRILDRYILRNFLVGYLIIAFVLMGLYTLGDLTVNSDEFTEQKDQTAIQVLGDIANYYGHQVFVYFRDLAGIITTVAAVVTLTSMNRRNEMTAILASGVSLYRVVWPVILLALLCNALALVDQELIMPRMADQLVRSHDETGGMKKFNIWFDRIYGISSDDDRCQVAGITASRNGQATWRVAPVGQSVVGPDGSVNAVRQMRPGDVLAVHVGQSDQVRCFVKVIQTSSGIDPAGPADQVEVTVDGVAQTGYDGFATARESTLEGVADGDRIEPTELPLYLFTALPFYPDSDDYRMEQVEIYKRHPRPPYGVLARIQASWATWDAAGQCWRLSPDAAMAAANPAAPGAEHVPSVTRTQAVAPLHGLQSPRQIALQHSSNRWLQFMSTSDLRTYSEARGASSAGRARSIMHIRFTQPIINMILLLCSVPFVLTRTPVGLWQGILRAVLISGTCFVLAFVCQQISSDAKGWSVVAAWLPVILFGPIAVLMLDSVKT